MLPEYNEETYAKQKVSSTFYLEHLVLHAICAHCTCLVKEHLNKERMKARLWEYQNTISA
jgi:hypothetical protein